MDERDRKRVVEYLGEDWVTTRQIHEGLDMFPHKVRRALKALLAEQSVHRRVNPANAHEWRKGCDESMGNLLCTQPLGHDGPHEYVIGPKQRSKPSPWQIRP